MDRKEQVFSIVSKLVDVFYDTLECFFVALVKIMIEKKFSDHEIKMMVDNTIEKVTKTRLTVADVLDNTLCKKRYDYV